jgi:hypothetical protein
MDKLLHKAVSPILQPVSRDEEIGAYGENDEDFYLHPVFFPVLISNE